MEGRILFKQTKVVHNAVGRNVSKDNEYLNRQAHTRINYRSNVAGIIKLVGSTKLRGAHMNQLKRTPFWIMIEAIHVNKLNHNEFRKCDDLISKIIRTYDPCDNAFPIGGVSVKFGSSDVRLIFGLQCRKRRLDLSPCQRPVSDFIQRRCHDMSRLTSKLVKSLFVEAVNGRTKQDEEDVAKLLALCICGKLFFANSGETISWAFVRYMNDLDTVRMYDWTGAIMTALMGPVKEFHRMPWKVTGCVVALLYWICEHSTIIEPQTNNMFPRFMKWDIGKLLSKVKVDRLRSFEYEREMMGADVVVFENVQSDVVDCVGGDDAFVDELKGDGIHTEVAMHTGNVEFGFGDVHEECSSWEGHKPKMTVGGKGTGALHGSTSGKDNEGVNDSKVNEYGSGIAILELENKRKDEMIALLEEEVAGLKKKLEAQAVNIVGGGGQVEERKYRITEECIVLEDQLANRDVHVVTQAFRDVEVRRNGVGGSVAGVRVGGQVVYDVSLIRAGMGGANMCNEDVGPNAGCVVVDSDSEQCGRNVAGIVNVDLSDVDGGVIVSGGQTSFVHSIKNKVRQERKLPDFEYPILHRRSKKSVTDSCVVVRNDDCVKSDGVIDVDAVVVTGNKCSGFDINNRLGVWKMMTVEEKCRIKQGYDRHGDRAVMWEDGEAGVDMVKNDDVRAMEKFVRTNVFAASDCRSIHFPMCHGGHWMLVVYDTEDGTWKHYNPMRQRGDRPNVHHNVATLLKERVTNVMKQTLREFGLDEQSILANFSSMLEAVTKCPQQKPGT
ncbi:hypothetical protein ACSBR2_027232 [Camellia fascicularis]